MVPLSRSSSGCPGPLFLPVRRLVTCWLNGRFTVLRATCGFGSCGPPVSPRLGTNIAVLSLCVPASQARTLGLGRHRVAQSSLLQQSGYLSLRPVGRAPPSSQEGGACQNARVYFYFQPPASIYPQGRPMNHRARWVGLAAACPLNPAPSLGPSPHTHPCLPRRPGSWRAPRLPGLSRAHRRSWGLGLPSWGGDVEPPALSLSVPGIHCSSAALSSQSCEGTEGTLAGQHLQPP